MEWKMAPLDFQLNEFELTKDREYWGHLWDPGLGKTKEVLDTAQYMYRRSRINALVVVCPKGVRHNWVLDEMPKHFPDSVPSLPFVWEAKKAKNKGYQKEFEELFSFQGLVVFVINYDSVPTDKGRTALRRILTERDTLMVLDESQRIKTPSASRTKEILKLSKKAKYRRILSGTPMDSPFDIFSQMKFLQTDYWKEDGCSNFHSFKTKYGVFEPGYNPHTGRQFKQLIGYRNTDRLKFLVSQGATRLRKDEVLDLPEKTYTTRYFELTPKQLKIYRALEEDYFTFLESGAMISAPLAITRSLRYRQILSGYVSDDDGNLELLGDSNPRMELFQEVAEETPGKIVVFAQFTKDIDLLCDFAGEAGVRFDGSVSTEDRELAKARIQNDPECKYFIAHPSVAGEGLTLHAAKTTIFYTNGWQLMQRLQAEDRTHRVGMNDEPARYIDLAARGTVDERVVRALVKKQEITAEILGDGKKKWLST